MFSMRGVKSTTATVTTTSLSDVVPAQSGFQFRLVGLFATNNDADTNSIKLFRGDENITPDMWIGGSGTFIWDTPAAGYMSTPIGSGVGAALGAAGSFTVTAHYIEVDKRTPVSKLQARSYSQAAITTRTPNAFGNQ